MTDLLRLTQWLSPAFPLSAYAYSHGLETAMAAGRVHDAPSAGAWIAAVLRDGTGALDAWLIRAAMAGTDPAELRDIAAARAGCAERWAETRDMGAAFVIETTALGEPPLASDLPLPVALGLRARHMEAETVVALYLQAFAGQLVGAAIRFVPLGQSEGQGVLRRLHPLIAEIAARDGDIPPQSALRADCDAMAHETLQPRIFRT